MAKIETLRVRIKRRMQVVDVTTEVQAIVAKSGVEQGVCQVYVPHTTVGVSINEHVDLDVATYFEGFMDRLIPQCGPYWHAEGNSDSHAKIILTGTSQQIFVEKGRLVLGRWQGIFFCEYDGPRERTMQVKVVADAG